MSNFSFIWINRNSIYIKRLICIRGNFKHFILRILLKTNLWTWIIYCNLLLLKCYGIIKILGISCLIRIIRSWICVILRVDLWRNLILNIIICWLLSLCRNSLLIIVLRLCKVLNRMYIDINCRISIWKHVIKSMLFCCVCIF